MTGNTVKNLQVMVFFGLVGTGKSYLARRWAEKNDLLYLNTDVVRKQLAGIEPSRRAGADAGKGIYTTEFSRRTYDELLKQCQDALKENPERTVVLDGSFHARAERENIIAGLRAMCEPLFVYCICPEIEIKKRLQQRLSDPSAVSDGNWEIYLQQKKKFEKPDELSKEKLLELDTSASLEYLIERLKEFLHTSGR